MFLIVVEHPSSKIKKQYEKKPHYVNVNSAGQKSIFSTVLKFKNIEEVQS